MEIFSFSSSNLACAIAGVRARDLQSVSMKEDGQHCDDFLQLAPEPKIEHYELARPIKIFVMSRETGIRSTELPVEMQKLHSGTVEEHGRYTIRLLLVPLVSYLWLRVLTIGRFRCCSNDSGEGQG